MNVLLLLPVLAAGLAACEHFQTEEPAVPEETEAVPYYRDQPGYAGLQVRGNVVEVRFTQSWDHLRRGGELWAKVGPYIYVFSNPTRQLFRDYPGLAAVRVVTLAPDGEEVARATLTREGFGEAQWNRAQGMVQRVLREGTQRPSRLQDLVHFGESQTEYAYSTQYVRAR